eukprot:3571353-Rhodomonas_salina.5
MSGTQHGHDLLHGHRSIRVLVLRVCYAMSSTYTEYAATKDWMYGASWGPRGVGYAATRTIMLCSCYAMSGTDIAYGATSMYAAGPWRVQTLLSAYALAMRSPVLT